MCYVYILKCNDNTLYTGWTNNLKKRINSHNSGKGSKYTRSRIPVKYVYTFKCDDKIQAMKFEYKIKQIPRYKKIDLINKKINIDNI